ncbi:MAG: ANTAR domain-containing protein [Bacteroides sp.]|nr:ANTAR domain-containing protein [Eubacterium sp.]MCM1418342.1 ANTAR domain-containing protein [Roseburia sp.]MCM1462824.1 ANTAR domain-containing protein [Bacteroides sp.]
MKVLIAARTTDAAETLARFFDEPTAEIRTATDGFTIRAIDLSVFDAVFVSIPLSGESGVELLSEIREKTDAFLFALVKEALSAELQRRVADLGVYVIPKPLFRGALHQAYRFARLNFENEQRLRAELNALAARLDEQKLVARAKLLLVERGLTEDEAHRRLQQTAMNRRITQAQAAAEIIGECVE